jgi:hypothetical protein
VATFTLTVTPRHAGVESASKTAPALASAPAVVEPALGCVLDNSAVQPALGCILENN